MSDRNPMPTPRPNDRDRPQVRLSVTRRHFLAGAGGAAAGLAAPGVPTSVAAPAAAQVDTVEFPHVQIARLSGLQVGQASRANYPDDTSPVLILKLGFRIPDGVGPAGDIVAYSNLCTHKGCPVTWRPDVQILSCPCHFSSFDPARGGMQVIGQATTNLPQLVLEVEGDNLIAVGMRGLVWGRQRNLQFTA